MQHPPPELPGLPHSDGHLEILAIGPAAAMAPWEALQRGHPRRDPQGPGTQENRPERQQRRARSRLQGRRKTGA